MKSKLLLAVAFLSIVLTSCTAKAPVPSSASDPGETAVPTTEHPIPWLDRTLEYLPEVLQGSIVSLGSLHESASNGRCSDRCAGYEIFQFASELPGYPEMYR